MKICGLTHLDDVEGVVRAGVDAVGLNFYPPGKRFVTTEQAAALAARLPAGIARVGVFVNASLEEVISARDAARLDFIQFHGDETPAELLRFQLELGSTPMLRALRLRDDPQTELEPYLKECRALGVNLAALLIDAYQNGAYGGTGRTTNWDALGAWTTRPDIPLILAGGLTPANVAQAIRTARADGVDTAGGVESSPGRKDAAASLAFVTAAQSVLSKSIRDG